jgi:hypothetical protein
MMMNSTPTAVETTKTKREGLVTEVGYDLSGSSATYTTDFATFTAPTGGFQASVSKAKYRTFCSAAPLSN